MNHDNFKIAVWGCGLIGSTSLKNFINAGYQCVGYDISKEKIALLNDEFSKLDINENRYYLTSDYNELKCYDIDLHVICVNTEKNGEPYSRMLEVVTETILRITKDKSKKLNIIIESTIPPIWLDERIEPIFNQSNFILNMNLFIGCSPRRDWFGSEYLNNVTRVIGASHEELLILMKEVYMSNYSNLIVAKDHKHAALSKIVENTLRFVGITLANELNLGLQIYDVNHIFALAGTKWNVENYRASLGIGGYCIPIAPLYAKEEIKQHSGILEQSINFHSEYILKLFNCLSILNILSSNTKVGIFGISYASNTDIISEAPSIKIINHLKDITHHIYGIDSKISSEVYNMLNIKKMNSNNISEIDILFCVTKHDNDYVEEYMKKLNRNCIIIDNLGQFESHFGEFKFYMKFSDNERIRKVTSEYIKLSLISK